MTAVTSTDATNTPSWPALRIRVVAFAERDADPRRARIVARGFEIEPWRRIFPAVNDGTVVENARGARILDAQGAIAVLYSTVFAATAALLALAACNSKPAQPDVLDSNPDPMANVGHGNRTIEEMSFAWVSYYYMTDEEYKAELEARKAERLKKTTTTQQQQQQEAPGGEQQHGEDGQEQGGQQKPTSQKPGADKPAADKPAADKPAADKPAADKPAADKPAVGKPQTTAPGEGQQTGQQQTGGDTHREKNLDEGERRRATPGMNSGVVHGAGRVSVRASAAIGFERGGSRWERRWATGSV